MDFRERIHIQVIFIKLKVIYTEEIVRGVIFRRVPPMVVSGVIFTEEILHEVEVILWTLVYRSSIYSYDVVLL